MNNKIVENLLGIINNVIDTTGMTKDEKSNVMNELVYHLTEDNIEKIDVVDETSTEDDDIEAIRRRILRESLEEVNPKLCKVWNITHDLWDEHTKTALYNLMHDGYTSIRIMTERILECIINYGYIPVIDDLMTTTTIYEDDNPVIITEVSYTLRDPNNNHYPFFMTVCFKYYAFEAYWTCNISFRDRTNRYLIGKCSYQANRYVFSETQYCYEDHDYRSDYKPTPMLRPEVYMYKYGNKCDRVCIKEDTVLTDEDFGDIKRYNNTVTIADIQYLYQMLKYGFSEIQLYKDNAEEEVDE